MVDEVRDISIRVKATQAATQLLRVGGALDDVGGSAGKTDVELRALDRQITKAVSTMASAARTIVTLRGELAAMGKEITALNSDNARLSARLLTANKRLAEQKEIMATQTTVIRQLTAQNLKLAGSYDAVGAAAGKAAGAQAAASTTRAPLQLGASPLARNALGAITPGGLTQLSEYSAGIKRVGASMQTLRTTVTSAGYALGTFGSALIVLEAVPVAVALAFDKEFAAVRRTVKGASDETKAELVNLSEAIPVSFKDLAGIATLGGQLGLSKAQIVDFTKVVSELTATTDLTTDAAGTLIGRFAQFYNLPSSQFENLASAILKVGVSTVATESQIATIATRLSGAGETLHLSAQEVIGFSAALASVAVRPYAAAGTFNRFAGVIQNAVKSGGAALKTLADVAGVTSDQFEKSFSSGKFDKTFTSLIAGMTDIKKNGGDAVNVLQQLGLTGVTDAQTFRQLGAIGPDAVRNIFKLSNDAFKQNTELSRQYNIIASTNAAKAKILGNSLLGYLNTLGQDGANAIGTIAPALTGLLRTMTQIASNPVAGAILGGGGIIAAFVGLAAVLGAVGLRGYGGLIALTESLRLVNLEGRLTGGVLVALQGELIATGGAGVVAARGLQAATFAAKTLAKAAVGIALLVGVVEFAKFLDDINKKSTPAALSIGKVKDATKDLNKYFAQTAKILDKQGASTFDLPTDKKYTVTQTNIQKVLATGANKGLKAPDFGVDDKNAKLAEGAIKNVDKALADLVSGGHIKEAEAAFNAIQAAEGGAAKNGVTYGAYLVKLSKLFPDYTAAVKQYAAQQRAAQDANESLANGTLDVTKTLNGLFNLGKKSTFLSDFASTFAKAVTPLTDFNSIVGQVQQGITDVSEAQKAGVPLSKYVADQNRDVAVSLAQVTDQTNKNNDAQQKYLSNLVQLSAQVASDPEAATSAASIVSTLLSAGYSVTNASFLQQLVDAAPEQRDAYLAANNEAMNLAGTEAANALLASGFLVVKGGGTIGADTAAKIGEALRAGFDIPAIMKLFNLEFTQNPLAPAVNTSAAQAQLNYFIASNTGKVIALNATVNGSIPRNLRGDTSGATGGLMKNKRIVPSFAQGTNILRGPGTGTSDSILANLSNGEAVMRARAVKYYGPGFMNDVNRMRYPKYAQGYVPSGPSQSTGMGVTELGPRSLAVLREAMSQEVAVYLGDVQVAQSARRGNAQLAASGVR